MTQEIDAVALKTYEVAADGSSVRLHVTDSAGRPAALSIPSECISQLFMTLPTVMRVVLKTRYNDDSLKVVFPASEWTLERSQTGARLILTLKTTDGFEASFGFDENELQSLADTLSDKAVRDQLSQSTLN